MPKKIYFLLLVILSLFIIATVAGFGLLGNNSEESWPPVVTNRACNQPPC